MYEIPVTPRPDGDAWQRDIDARIDALRAELEANTAVTAEIKGLLDAMHGGMRVLSWIGGAVKWLTPFVMLAGAVYGLWMQIKTGHK